MRRKKITQGNRAHVSHPLFSAPCSLSHTHTLILLFIFLHYSESLASSFSPSDDLLHCLLATQFNSRQLFLIHCVPGTELSVIRSQSHLGAESSWILPSHAQYLTQNFDHKIPSILPPKYHPNITRPTSLLPSHGSGPYHFSPPKKCNSLMCFPASSINPFPH